MNTVMQSFKKAKDAYADKIVLRRDKAKPDLEAVKEAERAGTAPYGGWEPDWETYTWSQYYESTIAAGRALMHLGIEQFDTVAIIGFNSPEWFLANMGAIACGGKAAGIYTTNGPDACKYIVEHSKSKVVVCEDKKHLAKFIEILNDPAAVPDLKTIVMWTGDVPEEANALGERVNIITWKDFMALSENVAVERIEERIAAQKPGHPCTLIYTSGTTGNPKAVMITHDNCTWTARVVLDWFAQTQGGGAGAFGCQNAEERIVSYLPLSHIAAQMLDIHMPIALAGHEALPAWATVTFARPDAMKGTLKSTMQQTLPTMFFGVPRVWEKFQEAMLAQGRGVTGLKATIAGWAKGKGTAKHEIDQDNNLSGTPFGYGLANSLVFSKVKTALGFTDCKIFITGAAPIAKSVMDYFGSLDIHVYELYGMSECTGPQTMSAPGFYKVGSCGHSLPGCEIGIFAPAAEPDGKPTRVGPGEEGEICFRGRHVMLGYMGEGMEAKTAETIDQDGWLHSGDKGQVDASGMLRITGRYKELLITAGGENIAPIPVEEAIKDALPMVEYVVMVADKRKFCSCLFVLKTAPGVNDGGQPIATNDLCAPATDVDEDCKTVTQACGEDYNGTKKWRDALTAGVKLYNENPVSQAAKIQTFKICKDGFSVGNGLLTDTLKLKRSKVYEKHAPLIEMIYAEADVKMAEGALKKATEEDKAALEKDMEDAAAAFEVAKKVLAEEYNEPQ